MNSKTTEIGIKTADASSESPAARVERIYRTHGGALMGWLLDEANARGHDVLKLKDELGVTYGYIEQLQKGIRNTNEISHDFAIKCASYLGVPTVVVMLVSGMIGIRDFAQPKESEELFVERTFGRILEDKNMASEFSGNASEMSFDDKKAMVDLYAISVKSDALRGSELPGVVRWLQRAAVVHNEGEVEAAMNNIG